MTSSAGIAHFKRKNADEDDFDLQLVQRPCNTKKAKTASQVRKELRLAAACPQDHTFN